MTDTSLKYSLFKLTMIFLGGLVLLFIIAPIAGMFISNSGSGLAEVSSNKDVINSIKLTLTVSFFSTVIFAIGAIPLAYFLARNNFWGKQIVSGIIDLPVVIPHSAAGIALLGFVSRDTFVGKAAGAVGLDFVGHPAGIAIAMAFVSVPYLINAARDGFSAVPERLEKAALNLGASPARVFFTIALPLAWRSILSGLILMFARGMSEFGAVIIIAYHPMITPVLIYEWFGAFGLDYARPVATIFIVVCLAFFVLLRAVSSKKK
ncbi:MAG TPA: molybdenum ABC transporter permease [Bacteroidales bacterium]|nr:molybdenum ABC transporter permease [Bacteroidales bacterium]